MARLSDRYMEHGIQRDNVDDDALVSSLGDRV